MFALDKDYRVKNTTKNNRLIHCSLKLATFPSLLKGIIKTTVKFENNITLSNLKTNYQYELAQKNKLS